MFKSKKAFTLIELLVVIAIIGILATVSVISLNNARAKSRDAKRAGDIKQIQTALELYFNDKGYYPSAAEWSSNSIFSTSSAGTSTYMTFIPSAPNPPDGNCSTATNAYGYSVLADGSSYTISYCLGNQTGTLAVGDKCATPSGVTDVNCVPAPLAFSPTDISSLKLWLKSDAGITKDGSNLVSQWNDQSGNGFNVASAGNNRPLWVDGVLNSKPAIRFNNLLNNYLLNASISVAQPATAIVVYKWKYASDFVFDGISARFCLFDWSDNDVNIFAGTSGFYHNGFYPPSDPYTTTISAVFNGVSSKIYDRGELKVTADAGTDSLTGITIGNRYELTTGFTSDMFELLIYNKVLSDAERQEVELYLHDKYNHY